MTRIFDTKTLGRRANFSSSLEPVTLDKFIGLNLIDNDRNLGHQYAVSLKNFFRDKDDSYTIRFGSKYIGTIDGVIVGNMLDMHYYNGALILAGDAGEIASMTGAGVATARWNDTIGLALPGAPGGWGTGYSVIDFVDFKSELILHNGEDKPIVFDSNFAVTYLQDPATGSNTNTPIGKYGTTVGNYHVIGGIAALPTTVYISSKGTSGVFPGDPTPNDSLSLDVGAYVTRNGDAIRGLQGFRNYLLIYFRTSTVVFQLGTYTGSTHEPTYVDTIDNFGLTGHRAIVPIHNDIVAGDITGASTARRNLFSQTVEVKHVSELIAPGWQGTYGALTNTQLLEDTWAVYDELDGYIMFFEPGGKVYTFVTDEQLRRRAWSEFEFETAWTCGCNTEAGRVYLAEGKRVFLKGNGAFSGEQYYADRTADRDTNWANSTAYTAGQLVRDTVTDETYTCAVNHTSASSGTFALDRTNNPTYWTLYEGEAISLEWEWPWLQADSSMRLKELRYVSLLSLGNAIFTLSLYVDHLYKDLDGDIVHNPALSMQMVGADSYGLGEEGFQLFGGGRRSDHPQLWKFPAKFKSFKWKITGSTRRKLSLVNLTMLYRRGLFKRA